MSLEVTFLDYDSGKLADEKVLTLKGAMSELMNSKIRVSYPEHTGTKTINQIVGLWKLKDLISEYGTAGPGKGDPEIGLALEVESGDLEIEGGEVETGGAEIKGLDFDGLPWDKLEEINGIGTARKKTIKTVLETGLTQGREEDGPQEEESE